MTFSPWSMTHVNVYSLLCIIIYTISTVTKSHMILKNVVCFICRNKNSRNYSLDSKKAKEDNFISKLSLLLDNVNYINKLCVIPTTVCKNCYSKITNVHDYLQDIRNCTSKYLEEGSVIVKRCASSPLTPNPVASKDISGVNS